MRKVVLTIFSISSHLALSAGGGAGRSAASGARSGFHGGVLLSVRIEAPAYHATEVAAGITA